MTDCEDHWMLYSNVTILDSRLTGQVNTSKCHFVSAEECLSQFSDKLVEEYGVIIFIFLLLIHILRFF